MAKQHIKLTVNGRAVEALVEPRMLLIHFLREEMGLTGAHIGCETSHCGACTVDLDGRSVKSCTVFAVQADGGEILTVEGMATADGLHPIQEGFIEASRPAVRVLHARHDHAHLPAAAGEPRSDARPRSAWASPATSAAAPAIRTSSRRCATPPRSSAPRQRGAQEAADVMAGSRDHDPGSSAKRRWAASAAPASARRTSASSRARATTSTI